MINARTKPKVWLIEEIYQERKKIGQLMLVSYLTQSKPHIEFFLNEEHWNKGIMSKELPKSILNAVKNGITTN